MPEARLLPAFQEVVKPVFFVPPLDDLQVIFKVKRIGIFLSVRHVFFSVGVVAVAGRAEWRPQPRSITELQRTTYLPAI